MPRGGKRAGAGRPPGPSKTTLSKIEGREILRRMVIAEMQPMIDAQVAHAKGLKYLVVRDKKSGKFVRVTEAMARAAQDTDLADTIEVWEKEPSTQAFTDLMNRTFDRPAEAEPEQPWKGELTLKWQD